jgi:hypothetical protein
MTVIGPGIAKANAGHLRERSELVHCFDQKSSAKTPFAMKISVTSVIAESI